MIEWFLREEVGAKRCRLRHKGVLGVSTTHRRLVSQKSPGA